MLSKHDLAEMKALVERIQQGSITREDWSNLAALTLVYQGDETVMAVAAQGLDTFIRTAQPVYEGHAFQHADYRRIYDRICAAAARVQRDLVH